MFILKAVIELAQNPLIRNTGLEIINTVLPQIVSSQVYQTQDYNTLKNKKIAFKITDYNIYIGCKFNDCIQFFDQEKSVDLLININSQSLFKLINNETNIEELVKNNLIQMDGNTQLLIHLFNLSALIDTSSEHILQKLFGTGPAVMMNSMGKTVSNIVTSINQFTQGYNNSYHVNNYFQDFLNNLPSPFKLMTTNDPFIDHSKK